MGGSPHCKVTAACVHQDVELSEKGEREMLSTRGSGLTTFMSFTPRATKSPFGMSRVKLLGCRAGQPGTCYHRDRRQKVVSPDILSMASAWPCVCSYLRCGIVTFSVLSEPRYLCMCVVFIPLFSLPSDCPQSLRVPVRFCLQSWHLPSFSGAPRKPITQRAAGLESCPARKCYSRSWHWPGKLQGPGRHVGATCF